jgi:hypothetical protein
MARVPRARGNELYAVNLGDHLSLLGGHIRIRKREPMSGGIAFKGRFCGLSIPNAIWVKTILSQEHPSIWRIHGGVCHLGDAHTEQFQTTRLEGRDEMNGRFTDDPENEVLGDVL